MKIKDLFNFNKRVNTNSDNKISRSDKRRYKKIADAAYKDKIMKNENDEQLRQIIISVMSRPHGHK